MLRYTVGTAGGKAPLAGKQEAIVMSEYRIKPGPVGKAVINGYKTVEDTVVGAYKKVEDAFVDAFLEKTENQPADSEQEAQQ